MNDNPYSPNCQAPLKPPEPEYKPTLFDQIVSFLIVLVIIGLATYGLMRLMRDTGIVFHDVAGEAHFWFEPKLREWIHR